MLKSLFYFQLSEEITGPPPVDDKSIEEESAWIYTQIMNGVSPVFMDSQIIRGIVKEDIGNFLGMLHIQKLDVRVHVSIFYLFILAF